MKSRLRPSLAFAASVLFSLALSTTLAFAQEGEAGASGNSWSDVQEVAVWSLVCVGIGCLLLGVLYLLKRRVGGFPKNPAWVAPISITRSADLPGDDNAGHEAEPPGGSHAAAH